MSYEEIQFEEKTVQLIPEDFELLSDYSWDMTGYTSRFGFFYSGNEKADVEGLTRWQAEHIFQLTPPPPGMEDAFPNIENGKHIGKDKRKEIIKKNEAVGDAYIVQAVQEKNLRYLSFFLHAYENRINAKVYFFLRRNGIGAYDPAPFLDLKLEKVTRRKKKIAAATYRYQADCDGEWGEIQFDFEKRSAKIIQLADWDTTNTKIYAKKVIDRILSTGGNDLPKKERIVFER